jgi:hypothetical protein
MGAAWSRSYKHIILNFNWDELLHDTDVAWMRWSPADVNRHVLAILGRRSVPRNWSWSGECFVESKNKATNRKWYFDMCVIGVVAHFVKEGHDFAKRIKKKAISRIDGVSESATSECFAAPDELMKELRALKADLADLAELNMLPAA